MAQLIVDVRFSGHVSLEETIQLRFKESDKKFTEKLTAIKQEMAARGLLKSGGSVKRGHEALVGEFIESRITIVNAFTEHLAITKPNKIAQSLINKAFDILIERKEFLEKYYQEQMKVVISSLQNQKMIAPYTTLNEQLALNKKELEIELAKASDSYMNSKGSTLFERVKNQFLDRPIVVIVIIVITVVTTTLTFLKLVGIL